MGGRGRKKKRDENIANRPKRGLQRQKETETGKTNKQQEANGRHKFQFISNEH